MEWTEKMKASKEFSCVRTWHLIFYTDDGVDYAYAVTQIEKTETELWCSSPFFYIYSTLIQWIHNLFLKLDLMLFDFIV